MKSKSMKLKIWTYHYNPFVMGGNCRTIMATEVEAPKAVSLGKGFTGHLIKVPGTRKTRVIEATTGAIVGNTLAAVRRDIETAEKKVMTKQVAHAKKQFKDMEVQNMKPDEFWAYLK